MASSLHLQSQDPTQPRLLDQIVEGARSADEGAGMFAWATVPGVDALVGHVDFGALCRRGTFHLVVGIDSITTTTALARLEYFENQLPGLEVQVFLNPARGLFHPKTTVFEGSGMSRVIAGSGNLTMGGLANNWEAFTDVELPTANWTPQSPLSTVRDWMKANSPNLVDVTDPRAATAAANNHANFSKLRAAEGGAHTPGSTGQAHTAPIGPSSLSATDPVIIAEIPKNRGNKRLGIPPEYSQVNFTKSIFHSFFGYRSSTQNTVVIWNVDAQGRMSNAESRVTRNKATSDNYYFEIGAARGRSYPATPGARPIVAFRRIGNGEYVYFLAAPGDPGFPELQRILMANSPKQTRRMRRFQTDSAQLATLWPSCPLN